MTLRKIIFSALLMPLMLFNNEAKTISPSWKIGLGCGGLAICSTAALICYKTKQNIKTSLKQPNLSGKEKASLESKLRLCNAIMYAGIFGGILSTGVTIWGIRDLCTKKYSSRTNSQSGKPKNKVAVYTYSLKEIKNAITQFLNETDSTFNLKNLANDEVFLKKIFSEMQSAGNCFSLRGQESKKNTLSQLIEKKIREYIKKNVEIVKKQTEEEGEEEEEEEGEVTTELTSNKSTQLAADKAMEKLVKLIKFYVYKEDPKIEKYPTRNGIIYILRTNLNDDNDTTIINTKPLKKGDSSITNNDHYPKEVKEAIAKYLNNKKLTKLEILLVNNCNLFLN